MAETSDPNVVVANLKKAGEQGATQAFRTALGSVEYISKEIAPKGGPYGKRRGYSGRDGGDLRKSLRVIYLGKFGDELRAWCVSDLPYARMQHDGEFHHPGLYTNGSAGSKYKSLYFKAAFEWVFDYTGQKRLYNPGNYSVVEPARFKDLIEDLVT